MGELYFRLVLLKVRTCNIENRIIKHVPEKYLNEVITLLITRGYDKNGDYLEDLK